MQKQVRRPLATISFCGVSYLQQQDPRMVAWWSVVFPGFGHYLLFQYGRGTLYTISEVIFNTLSHVNEAIVFTFSGRFELAKSVLQTRWLYGYLLIYFFCIWSSYRSTIVQNKMAQLAEIENEPLPNNLIHRIEIQYLEQKNPYTAAIFSFFFPGLGQVYNQRFILAFYAMFWWWVYLTFSHAYEAAFYLFMGNITQATAVLHPHWLLFMPSVIGGSVYHSFVMAIEQNRLFKLEQRQHLLKRYQNTAIRIFS